MSFTNLTQCFSCKCFMCALGKIGIYGAFSKDLLIPPYVNEALLLNTAVINVV